MAGIGLGLLGLGLAAAFGVAALMAQSTLIYQALRGAGVVYLLWLAWDAWRSARIPFVEGRTQPLPRAQYFRRGLITNLLNPKAYLFMFAVFPQFFRPGAGSAATHAVVLWLICGFTQALVYGPIALAAGGAATGLATRPRLQLIVVRAAGAMLLLGAAWTASEGWRRF